MPLTPTNYSPSKVPSDVDYSEVSATWGSRTSLSASLSSAEGPDVNPNSWLAEPRFSVKNSSYHKLPEYTTVEVSSNKGLFNPTPYTFTLPKVEGGRKDHRVECPPFHTLLDHTIAVIWILYCKSSSTELGIVHLYWALSFLQTIRNHEGETPDDIAMIIEAIQIRLAHMHIAVETFIDPQSSKLKSNVSYKHVKPQASSLTAVQSTFLYRRGTEERMKSAASQGKTSEQDYPVSIALKNMLENDPTTLIELFKQMAKVVSSDVVHTQSKSTPSIPDTHVELEHAVTDQPTRAVVLKMLTSWCVEICGVLQQELARLKYVEGVMQDFNIAYTPHEVGEIKKAIMAYCPQ